MLLLSYMLILVRKVNDLFLFLIHLFLFLRLLFFIFKLIQFLEKEKKNDILVHQQLLILACNEI